MEKLTGEGILQILMLKEVSWSDLGYDWVDWKSLNLGDVECVDEYGGEGQGETYYKVYHFKQHDVYIRINGFYQSYEGAEFNHPPYEVKPKQKTITFYESC